MRFDCGIQPGFWPRRIEAKENWGKRSGKLHQVAGLIKARGSDSAGCTEVRPAYGGGTPPDGILITIQTIMSQAFRMAARSNVSTAAAIRLALAVDCASNSAAAIIASRYPRSGSRK